MIRGHSIQQARYQRSDRGRSGRSASTAEALYESLRVLSSKETIEVIGCEDEIPPCRKLNVKLTVVSPKVRRYPANLL